MKDTAGNEIQEPTYCSYCQVNTAGEHEYNCPNNNDCGLRRVMCDKCGYPHWEEKNVKSRNQ